MRQLKIKVSEKVRQLLEGLFESGVWPTALAAISPVIGGETLQGLIVSGRITSTDFGVSNPRVDLRARQVAGHLTWRGDSGKMLETFADDKRADVLAALRRVRCGIGFDFSELVFDPATTTVRTLGEVRELAKSHAQEFAQLMANIGRETRRVLWPTEDEWGELVRLGDRGEVSGGLVHHLAHAPRAEPVSVAEAIRAATTKEPAGASKPEGFAAKAAEKIDEALGIGRQDGGEAGA